MERQLLVALAVVVAVAAIGVAVYVNVVAPMLSGTPCPSATGGCIEAVEVPQVRVLSTPRGFVVEAKLYAKGTGYIMVQLISPTGRIIGERRLLVNGFRVVVFSVPGIPGNFTLRVLHEGKVLAEKRFTLHLAYPRILSYSCFYDGLKHVLTVLLEVQNVSNVTLHEEAHCYLVVDGRRVEAQLISTKPLLPGARSTMYVRIGARLEPGAHEVKVIIPSWNASLSLRLRIPLVRVVSVKLVGSEIGEYVYELVAENKGPGDAVIEGAYGYAKVMGASMMLRALRAPHHMVLRSGTQSKVTVVFGGRVEKLWLVYSAEGEGYRVIYETPVVTVEQG